MAFTGVAVVQSLGSKVVRITGLSLAASASGTIGLSGGSGGVSLPASFPSAADAAAAAAGLTMVDLVDVRFQRGSGGTQAAVINVAKAASPFLITISNPDAVNASGPFDFYVQYFFSASR